MSDTFLEKYIGDYKVTVDYEEDIDFDIDELLNYDFDLYLYTWHRNYRIGMPNPFSTREEMFAHILDMRPETFEGYSNDELLKKASTKCVILPVYMYDHSGIALSTSPFNDPWDSGLLGYIFAYKDDIRKAYGVTRISPKLKEDVLEVFKHNIKIIDDVYNGNVFKVTIEDINQPHLSCCYGGIIGSDWDENDIMSFLQENTPILDGGVVAE